MLKLKHIKVEQTEHKTNEQPQKYHLRTASNSKCRGGGGGVGVEWGGGGGEFGWSGGMGLRCTNLHPHLPLRFSQFSWLFGSHGGPLAHKCVVTDNT